MKHQAPHPCNVSEQALPPLPDAGLESLLKARIRIIGTLSLDDLESAPRDLQFNQRNKFLSTTIGAVTRRHLLGELRACRFPTTPIRHPHREPHI